MKENSREEDRKILEKLINTMKLDRELFDEKTDKEIYTFFINALEHILSDYKRVLEINKVLLKENEILKEEKEQAWEEWNNLEQRSYEIEQKLKQQIQKSQKENEELNLKYYMLYTEKIENLKAQEVKIKSQVIPFQKVKDKIEELQKTNFNDYTKKQDGNNVKMEILYEFKKMLESEEK